MKSKNFMKYFKEGVLKYFKISIMKFLNISKWNISISPGRGITCIRLISTALNAVTPSGYQFVDAARPPHHNLSTPVDIIELWSVAVLRWGQGAQAPQILPRPQIFGHSSSATGWIIGSK